MMHIGKKWAVLPVAATLLILAYLVGVLYLPEGYDMYAAHFESLPEAQLFLKAYPDARPGYTNRHTFGFIADGQAELSIHHDRLSFEPERIVIECSEGHNIKEYLKEFITTAGCAAVYPDGYARYAEHFEPLPKVQAFLKAYPDARPGYTARYTMGFIAEGDVRTELSIHHDGLEPGRIVIDCHYSEYFGVKAHLEESVEIIRCGTGYYPEGHIAHTAHFMSLPEVGAFLGEYPDARPDYTGRKTMGLVAEADNIRAELSMHHDGFSFEPDSVIDCYRDGILYDITDAKTGRCM